MSIKLTPETGYFCSSSAAAGAVFAAVIVLANKCSVGFPGWLEPVSVKKTRVGVFVEDFAESRGENGKNIGDCPLPIAE